MTPEERADQVVTWFKREATYNRRRDKYEWPGVLVWAGLNVRVADAIRAAVQAEREACEALVKNMKGCGAVSTPADDWCEQRILGIAQAIRARTAQDEGEGRQ